MRIQLLINKNLFPCESHLTEFVVCFPFVTYALIMDAPALYFAESYLENSLDY